MSRGASPAPAPAAPRQRWRVVYRRRADAPPLPQRDQLAAWETSLTLSGLPLARLGVAVTRPRLVFAAPLGVGMAAERELLDLFLEDRRSIAEVRVRLAGSLPAGHELIDLHDVWLGDPPLPGQVVAAEYRLEVTTPEHDGAVGDPAPDAVAERVDRAGAPDTGTLVAACTHLLAAVALPRARDKGGRTVAYDLRPLVEDVRVATDPGGASDATVVMIRTRFDPERGAGRPEEVLATLSELARISLTARSIVRERLLLAGDVEPRQPAGQPANPSNLFGPHDRG